MDNDFIPRIVVPDDGDKATLVAALMRYSHYIAHTGLTCMNPAPFIKEQGVIVNLMSSLVQSAQEDLITKSMDMLDSPEDFSELFGEIDPE